MELIKLAKRMLWFWIVFFIIYNTYFGWNRLPQSETEKTLDWVFEKGIVLTLGIYFAPTLSLYEKLVRKKLQND